MGTEGAFVVCVFVKEKLSSELFNDPKSPQVAPMAGAGLLGKALEAGKEGGPCAFINGGGALCCIKCLTKQACSSHRRHLGRLRIIEQLAAQLFFDKNTSG